eukprot:9485932-Heterocapsa_arctica.AAC.1
MTEIEEGTMKATPPFGLAALPQPTVAGAGMTRLPGKPFSHLAAVDADQWDGRVGVRGQQPSRVPGRDGQRVNRAMTRDFVTCEGERSVSAKLAPCGIARHGSGMDEPPEGLPGATAVENFNGGKPFMKEARGRDPERGA